MHSLLFYAKMRRHISVQGNSLRITLSGRGERIRKRDRVTPRRRATVISDSMCRGISRWLPVYEQVHGGATPSTLKEKILSGEINLHFDQIILHVGTNLITRRWKWWDVVDSVIRLARFIRAHAPTHTRVTFISILPRPIDHYRSWRWVKKINEDLKQK